MAKKDRFNTKSKHNAGAKMFIKDESGAATEDWLLVLGCDSDHCRQRKNEKDREYREAFLSFSDPKDESKRIKEFARIEFDHLQTNKRDAHTFVIGWSFDDEKFSTNAVREWLVEATDVADQIVDFATSRALFLASVASCSSATPKPNSGSTE